jgi:hypothetical protein
METESTSTIAMIGRGVFYRLAVLSNILLFSFALFLFWLSSFIARKLILYACFKVLRNKGQI